MLIPTGLETCKFLFLSLLRERLDRNLCSVTNFIGFLFFLTWVSLSSLSWRKKRRFCQKPLFFSLLVELWVSDCVLNQVSGVASKY